MSLGYCGVGYVEEVGSKVTKVSVGDRVLVYHGCHSQYNIRPECDITKVENNAVSSLEAAFVVIASMGLGGVRKLEIELGESAMVMGQGLLGIFNTIFKTFRRKPCHRSRPECSKTRACIEARC